MNKFLYILSILGILLKLPVHANALFNVKEQKYIDNVENMTVISELEEFFDVQSSIYINNVFGVYQKFLYKLLGELPQGMRYDEIKLVLHEIDEFLEIEDFREKVAVFDGFTEKFSVNFEMIFEYESDETHLSGKDFNDLFVNNGAEELLNYVNQEQEMQFINYTGNGIRVFLIRNRAQLNKESMLEFKTIVDEFLEAETFAGKRQALKLFIVKSREFL